VRVGSDETDAGGGAVPRPERTGSADRVAASSGRNRIVGSDRARTMRPRPVSHASATRSSGLMALLSLLRHGACYNLDMRIVVAGDPFWPCHRLASAILRRMVTRYGPDIMIVHGDDTGVAESFATAARGQRIRTEVHLADFVHLATEAIRFRNREMLRAGAQLCVIVHRSVLDAGTRDLARQAIEVGVPTYLIDSDEGKPRRIWTGDARLG
jgi:hypothetical protein